MSQTPERISFAQAGFDPRWPHPRNQKTGKVAGHNGFRVLVTQSAEGKGSVTLYEYPVGSKIFYVRADAPDGTAMLQLEKSASAEGLRKLEEAEKLAKRSALEKADANLKQAQAEYEKARKDRELELAAEKPAAPKAEAKAEPKAEVKAEKGK